MKKRITLFMLFVLGSGCLFSQKGFNVQIDLQPGVSFLTGKWKLLSTYGSDAYMKKSFTFSFEGGGTAGYNFTDHLGVSAGIFYASQGQNYQTFNYTSKLYGSYTDNSSLNQTIRLSYIKIPIKFVYSTDPEKPFSFTGSAGFYVGILACYKETVKNNTSVGPSVMDYTQVYTGKTVTETSGSSSDKYTLTSRPFRNGDFGITIGGTVQKKLPQQFYVLVGISGEVGFIDVKNITSEIEFNSHNYQDVYNSSDPNRTTNHFNSLVGIKVGVKKCF
jgi:hypothetical protein